MPSSPPYPVYPSVPYTGDLPSQINMGPFDLYPSSTTAPYYQRRFDNMYGRHLAGVEKPVGSDEEPAYALNELRLMAEMDDTNGNGLFDPPGTRANVYPDAGIMASSYALPGYLHRDRMYAPSEVIDANTGRPTVYVNGGMVSMDSTAEIAFIEGGAYPKPAPYLDMYSEQMMPQESTANIMQHAIPVTSKGPPSVAAQPPLPVPPSASDAGAQAGFGRYHHGRPRSMGDISPLGQVALIAGIMGLGVGVVYVATRPSMTPNKKRKRSRR